MSDLMREEFEIAFVARCKKKGEVARLDRFDDGRYEYLDASDAWWAWQASRECLVITMPIAAAYPANEAASEADYYFDQGQADGILKAATLIHAAGVKTK